MAQFGLVGHVLQSGAFSEKAHLLRFTFQLGARPKLAGRVFIPLSRSQVRVVTAAGPLEHDIRLAISRTKKRVTFSQGFPFGTTDKRLNRAGVTLLVHHAVTEYLASKPSYKRYKLNHDPLLTIVRTGTLKSIGINPEKQHSLRTYRTKVRKAVAKRFGSISATRV